MEISSPHSNPAALQIGKLFALVVSPVLADIDLFEGNFGIPIKSNLIVAELRKKLHSLAEDSATPTRLVRLNELQESFKKQGVDGILRELQNCKVSTKMWVHMFAVRALSCSEAIQSEDPELASFNGRAHDTFVDEFKSLDAQKIKLTPQRVSRIHALRAVQQ